MHPLGAYFLPEASGFRRKDGTNSCACTFSEKAKASGLSAEFVPRTSASLGSARDSQLSGSPMMATFTRAMNIGDLRITQSVTPAIAEHHTAAAHCSHVVCNVLDGFASSSDIR